MTPLATFRLKPIRAAAGMPAETGAPEAPPQEDPEELRRLIDAWNPLIQLMLFKRRGLRTVVRKTNADGQQILYGNERILPPIALERGFRRVGIEPVSTRYFRLLPNVPAASSLASDLAPEPLQIARGGSLGLYVGADQALYLVPLP